MLVDPELKEASVYLRLSSIFDHFLSVWMLNVSTILQRHLNCVINHLHRIAGNLLSMIHTTEKI